MTEEGQQNPGGDTAGGVQLPAIPPEAETDDNTISLSFADMTPDITIPGYTIIREINKGGQAIIFLAIQESTGRKVAIKLIYQANVSDTEKERMDREVRVLAELDHSNIVSIIDRGETPEGWPYFVMEYIQGRTLQEYMLDYRQQHPPLGLPADFSDILRLFIRICDTINAAHLRGIVHRDLKPANIIIDTYGDPHILDFGLAHGAAAWLGVSTADTQTEKTFEFHGSLPWASPEQAEGDLSKLDTRTDVYSLGVILFQILTGDFPYEVFGKAIDTLQNIRDSKPSMPSDVIKRKLSETTQQRTITLRKLPVPVDELLDKIVLKALEKQQSNRYQTAGAFSQELSRYLSGRPTTISTGNDTTRSRGPALSTVLLTAIIVGGGLYFWKNQQAYRQPPMAQPATQPAQVSPTTTNPAQPDTPPMSLWGYKIEGKEIKFEFNSAYYEKVRLPNGNMGTVPPPEEIFTVHIAGTFNEWNPTDPEWKMQKTGDPETADFALYKDLSILDNKPAWPFKFVINGDTWVSAPLGADNKEAVVDDAQTFNLLIFNPNAEYKAQYEVTRIYRQQIDRAWPGMGSFLTVDGEGNYRFSFENKPSTVLIKDLEPLREIPLTSLHLGTVFVSDFSPLIDGKRLDNLIFGTWLYDFLMSELLKAVKRNDFDKARDELNKFVQDFIEIPAFKTFEVLITDSLEGLEALRDTPDTIPAVAQVYEGHHYLYAPSRMNWHEAKAFCEKHGAHLATITSKEEHAWIVKNFGSIGLGQKIWLGGTDEGTEGTWRWVNGDEWSFENWTGEEPNNLYNNEHTLVMQRDGYWFDAHAINDRAHFLIEWDR